jgi:hypothetical protein
MIEFMMQCVFLVLLGFVSEKMSIIYDMQCIRKVSTVCKYFLCSAEVVISRVCAVFPHSLASHTPIQEKQIVFTYCSVCLKCSR